MGDRLRPPGGYRATDIPTAILGGFLRQARARLDKTGHTKPEQGIGDEVVSKPFTGGAYAHQRLNLVANGKAHRRNARASNRT